MNTAAVASFSRLRFKPESRHRSSAASPPPPSVVAHGLPPCIKFLGGRSARPVVVCNSSSRPGGSGSGESESRNILDAFFLGKAVAEAIGERVETTIGEFLSTVGRLQAEQQKQVQEFQEEVLERAKRSKERAARESMEAPKSIVANTRPISDGAKASPSASSSSKTPESNLSSNADPVPPANLNDKSDDRALDVSSEA